MTKSLLSSQAHAAETTLAYSGWTVRNDLLVLSDPNNSSEIAWAEPAREVVNIYQNYARLGQQYQTAERWDTNISTQLTPTDKPCRILAERNGWLLIQADDLTLGWAAAQDMAIVGDRRAEWESVHRAPIGQLAQDCAHLSEKDIASFADRTGIRRTWEAAQRELEWTARA